MSTYRNKCAVCGDETITESWEPEDCPFCELTRLRAELAEARKDAECIKEAVDDAAYEWASYVDVDHAPVTLRAYMEGAVRAAIAGSVK